MGKDITFYSDTTSSFYGGAFLSEEAYFFNQGWSGREGGVPPLCAGLRDLSVWRDPSRQRAYFILPLKMTRIPPAFTAPTCSSPWRMLIFWEELNGVQLTPGRSAFSWPVMEPSFMGQPGRC